MIGPDFAKLGARDMCFAAGAVLGAFIVAGVVVVGVIAVGFAVLHHLVGG